MIDNTEAKYRPLECYGKVVIKKNDKTDWVVERKWINKS